MLGHDLIHHDEKAATCTEKGWAAYDTCSRCDYTTYQEIPALGHQASEWITGKPATCESAGNRHKECTVCHEILESETLPALGHAWGEWKQTKAPTCTEEGEEQRVCANDPSHVETRAVIALGHEYVEGKCVYCGQRDPEIVVSVGCNSTLKGIGLALSIGVVFLAVVVLIRKKIL